MSIGAWFGFVVSAFWPLGVAYFWRAVGRLVRRPRRSFMADYFGCAIACLIIELFIRAWPWAAGFAVSIAAGIAWWWWRSGWRKRAQAALGAKSRALRAKLVRRMRESAKPRPVLHPVPGGAR